MPKVILTEQQRMESRSETAGQSLRVLVSACMMRDRLKQADIARKIGMNPSTFTRRLRDPGSFTLDEFRRLASALRFSDKELQRCV